MSLVCDDVSPGLTCSGPAISPITVGGPSPAAILRCGGLDQGIRTPHGYDVLVKLDSQPDITKVSFLLSVAFLFGLDFSLFFMTSVNPSSCGRDESRRSQSLLILSSVAVWEWRISATRRDSPKSSFPKNLSILQNLHLHH